MFHLVYATFIEFRCIAWPLGNALSGNASAFVPLHRGGWVVNFALLLGAAGTGTHRDWNCEGECLLDWIYGLY